jgi:hypothetical protein
MRLQGITRGTGALLATGLLILLGGCAQARPNVTTSSPPTTVARAAGQTTVGCSMSRPLKSSDAPTSADLRIGPLWYPGLAHGYPASAPEPQDGIIFAKIGTQQLPDATVTVSIAPDAQGWAGIATEAGPPAGYSSVTYVSCPATQHPAGVWWVGGFTLRSRSSGCLPLEIRVDGEDSVRHILVALWDRSCA